VIIIWLELIMHPTVALVFETDPGDPLAMRRPPRDPRRAILPARELLTSVATGVSIGAGILALYAYQLGSGAAPAAARAVALCSLVLAEMFLVTIELSRSRMGAAMRNVFFWVTRALTLGVLLVFLYVPSMTETMQLAPVGAAGWLEALGVAGVTTIWVEAVLYLRRRNAGP
jgi:magnesium-transporting ATPase (P-type)